MVLGKRDVIIGDVFYPAVLVGPMLYYGYKYYWDFYVYERRVYFRQLFPFSLFVLYLLFVCVLGSDESIRLFNDGAFRARGFFTYLLPAFGFAFAVFPYQAAEASDNYIHYASLNLTYYFRYIGWIILGVVVLRHLLSLS